MIPAKLTGFHDFSEPRAFFFDLDRCPARQ